MKDVSLKLAVFGGIALLALVLATPAPAEPGRQHSRQQWQDEKRQQSKERRRHRKRARTDSSGQHYRYFGADPDRYFGIGPGSYDCYGYDCNW